MYAADSEAVARGLKIITGCEPDDEEQDVLPAFVRLAHNVGMDEYLTGVEAWYTTRLGSSEPFASSAEEEVSLCSIRLQVAALTLVILKRQNSTDAFGIHLRKVIRDEWDASLTDKEDLENVLLIPKLKRFHPRVR